MLVATSAGIGTVGFHAKGMYTLTLTEESSLTGGIHYPDGVNGVGCGCRGRVWY